MGWNEWQNPYDEAYKLYASVQFYLNKDKVFRRDKDDEKSSG